ncbi:MAG: hypothetical protein J6T22_08045, partial [Bacteroidales bacterium]|nr:hypothetical protein [Bacteroidales bacterium]
EWRNNKQETIATVSATTGYLYANSEAIELSLTGSTYPSYNEEVIPVTVPYDEGSTNPSNGWALLGNPYTCNAYVYCHNSDNELVPMEFMVYDATGELMTLSDEPIAPMQGFFVKVTETTTVYILNYADHSFHEYVDLGLPSGTLWATCNVGATNPEDYGNYYAWGETQPKDAYDWSTYQYCMGSNNTLTKYCNDASYGYNGFIDNLTTLLPEDDAATANWGTEWHTPTKEEWQELLQNTTETVIWGDEGSFGFIGSLFTASNGNSIFLSTAGFGDACCYMSSSLYTSIPYLAWNFYEGPEKLEGPGVTGGWRSSGRPVRPVRFASQFSSYIIDATANPAEGGEVSGMGTYQEGTECTLTATANEGYTFANWTENDEVVSVEATYTFTVNVNRTLVANFTSNGGSDDHEYVDLGLPSGLLWATCNVGAENPEDYGDHFAWGETQPKDNFSWTNYQYCMGSFNTLTKYCNNPDIGYNGFTDDLTTLLPEDDAATANWGDEWRMPTEGEWQELYENTTVTWTMRNGVRGRLFTATNGNSIFLPAAGYCNESLPEAAGIIGDYWTSSLDTDYPSGALSFFFNSSNYYISFCNRLYGRNVRAVRSGLQSNVPIGAINGKFTINEDGDQVYFSQGNLQYQASTDTWKFADNQFDYVGSTNSSISSTYSGWIDLFGWGTSGYHNSSDPYNVNYQPWSTSTSQVNSSYNYYGYGPSTNMTDLNLTGTSANYDWGVYNPISNGGNTANQWRTLTRPEWNYVFNTRATTSGIRYAKANVNNVNGVILLPDDWSTSTYSLNNTNSSSVSFSSNTLTASQWSTLEQAGAVFLPAAGIRGETYVNKVGSDGYYWSASYCNSGIAFEVEFHDNYINVGYPCGCYCGVSVRVVCPAEN